jgi:hypothetical protein
MLRKMVPDFTDADVVDWTVQRARLVEPVHTLGAGARIAPIWPGVRGLGLASNAQIYPWLLNGDSVIRFAEQVAGQALERLETTWLTDRPTTPLIASSTASSSAMA